jgi:sensor histidine kinase YesM
MFSKFDPCPPKAIVLTATLATSLYIILSIGKLYGETNFYDPVEHFIFVLYGMSSFFSCIWITRFFIVNEKINPGTISKIIIFSGLINAIITTAIFLLTRKIVFTYFNLNGWWPPISGIVSNVGYTFFVIHLIIAALYLSYVTLQLNHLASIKQSTAEKDHANTQLKLLQQQFTPHFLFNNLNILACLIPVDPKLAEQYITQFSSLYRFIIKHKDDDLILLSDELEFIHQYCQVMNIRFNNAYQLQVDDSVRENLTTMVAPGALQSCVENAIKHNIASNNEPLLITIKVNNELIEIENFIKRKKYSISSTKTGLANLIDRYQTLSKNAVLIENSPEYFKVSIPLITLLNESN